MPTLQKVLESGAQAIMMISLPASLGSLEPKRSSKLAWESHGGWWSRSLLRCCKGALQQGVNPAGAAICTVGTHHCIRGLKPVIFRIMDSIPNIGIRNKKWDA